MLLVGLECAGAMLSVSSYLQVASAELSAGLQKLSGLEERERECTALEGRLAERERECTAHEGRLAELQRALENMVAQVIVKENYQSTREEELSRLLLQAKQQRDEVAFNAAGVARQQASVYYQCVCTS